MMDSELQPKRVRGLPTSRDGETVYSFFCRYATRSNKQRKIILQSLTGQTQLPALLSAVPGHLRAISERVPEGHPWSNYSYILEKNTSFPYFTYFDGSDSPLKQHILNKLEISSGIRNSAFGLSTYPCPATQKHPKFCIECCLSDMEDPGYSYFHREHQLPGVSLCWKHKIPLHNGCEVCGPYPILRNTLKMPYHCCCEGIYPALASSNLPQNIEGLHWMAEQSAFMVNSSGTNSQNIRQDLKQVAILNGCGKGKLLIHSKLAEAVKAQFGQELLEWLGAPVFKDNEPTPWIRRLFGANLHGSKRAPAIYFLLVIGTFFNSVEEFEEAITNGSLTTLKKQGSKQAPLNKDEDKLRLNKRQIGKLIEFCKNPQHGIPWIAKELGCTQYDIVAALKNQKIRLPLSPGFKARVGLPKIKAIRSDLRSGKTKKAILKKHDIGEWTLTVIELDDLQLNEINRQARQQNRKTKHVRKLEKIIDENPRITRDELMSIAYGTYEYLLNEEPELFDTMLPAQRKNPSSNRKDRNDWGLIDRTKALEILKFLGSLPPEDKPVHMTKTFLLEQVCLTRKFHSNQTKFPLVSKLLERESETQEQYIERKIEWGILQAKKNPTPLTCDRLRRIVGMHASVLYGYKEHIISVAKELNVTIGERSFKN